MQESLSMVHVDAESGFSGGEVQVFLLLEGLRARGHRLLLVAPPGSRALLHAQERGFESQALAMRSDLDLLAVPRLARILHRFGAQLVHLHTGRATWLGALAARVVGLPALSTRRMDRAVAGHAKNRVLYSRLLARVVAISPRVLEQLVEGGVPRARLALINSSVDPAALVPRAGRELIRAAEKAQPGEFVLLVLASLVRRKGLDVLLEALALLKLQGLEPRLWIGGAGPELVPLDRQMRALELERQVRFLGARRDVADLLAGCDALVLPSRAEGLGVAALEAMAVGKPVIASKVGGLGELVRDGECGLLVPPEDPQALCAALERLLCEPHLAQRLGAGGPPRVAQGFLASQMVDSYDQLYRSVLASRAALVAEQAR